MAGWQLDFDVDRRDTKLARDCFKIWRRTCARHSVEMTYKTVELTATRHRFRLTYNLCSRNLPPAAAEFIIEMRAVSTLYRGERQRRVPLRLMREVVWNAITPIQQQLEEAGQVDMKMIPKVTKTLENLESAVLSFISKERSAADFLETLHTTVISLGVDLVSSVDGEKDYFPNVVCKLPVSSFLKARLMAFNRPRNYAKHRSKSDEAKKVVWDAFSSVERLVDALTGAWIDAVSAEARKIEKDPDSVFKSQPMFWRSGQKRRA